MSTINPHVLAAISGAMAAYLADEEAGRMAAAGAAPAPGPPLNLWGVSGRQAAMQLRLLMQRRSLR
ncbi:MAG: hypothetical protein A2139_12985 [Desulfobacca sp. RBG_16_60_12]|nr:MAG: hypothetical protein A2139_12985 [Desulfobacca sp. RBG_16_60_12]